MSTQDILAQLNRNGFQAYVVGGAVRDQILGRSVSDEDIATDARPDDVVRIFADRVSYTDNSLAHGTVFVDGVDVTTFRTDHDEDGFNARVEFADSILDDVSRRDFTFNGMARLPNGEIYDPFDGQGDLERRVVRAIGDAQARVRESFVRMLRACRFMALHPDMQMDEDLFLAIVENQDFIEHVPSELIQHELMKMLSYPAPENGIMALRDTGLLAYVLPALAISESVSQEGCHRHEFNVFRHCVTALSAVSNPNPRLRLAVLLHDVGKIRTRIVNESGVHFYSHESVGAEVVESMMTVLHFSNADIRYVTTLVREHMVLSSYFTPTSIAGVRRLLGRLGPVPVEDLIELKIADRFGRDGRHGLESEEIARIRQMVQQIRDEAHALRVTDLVIGGDDLIVMGMSPGPVFGQILNQLLEEVLTEPRNNTRTYLMARAEEIAG